MVPARRPLAFLVPAVVAGSLVPFGVIAYKALAGKLGSNPVAIALNQLGLLALVFLMASLACTPMKIVFGWKWPLRVRRTLGLYAFFAALLHFLVYVVLDQNLALGALGADLTKRPFIIVGFLALLLLVPLAWTSNKRAVQALGFARWKRIHRLVYAVGVLAVIHFYMRVKKDVSEPLLYGAVLALLLGLRVVDGLRTRKRKAVRAAEAVPGE